MPQELIILEKFEKDDYGRLISWIDSEELLMQIAGPSFTFPLTIEQLDVLLSDEKKFVYKIIHTETREVIGHCDIYYSENSAKLDWIIIGDAGKRGQGLGQLAVKILCDIVFSKPEMAFVELNVFDWNAAAIKCYEKMGFALNPDKKFNIKIESGVWIAINMIIERKTWSI